MANFGYVCKEDVALLTDLYEFTMSNVYVKRNISSKRAVFEFFVRPSSKRNFYIFAGLEQLLALVEDFRFSEERIDYLRSLNLFSKEFLEYLRGFKFTGNIYSLKEGEFFFANEPVVVVEAPLTQAQILETMIINTVQLQTMIATKAIRCYLASKGKYLVDFSLIRPQVTYAILKAAIAAYIGGFAATSNVLAGEKFGIPITGTMAHSFILSFGDEKEAFRAFAEMYPENVIFLIDTFDVIKGVYNAIEVAKEMRIRLKGVRIDSGDLVKFSKEVRKILDENGFTDTKILASGGIDEYEILKLEENKAPIDAYGVGTKLVVSADAPYLDCAYKLVEIDKRPVMKLSSKKITLPFKKQIFRYYDKGGRFLKDVVGMFEENLDGKPLLQKVVDNGKVVYKPEDLQTVRERAINGLSILPDELLDIENSKTYIPFISDKLQTETEKVKKALE